MLGGQIYWYIVSSFKRYSISISGLSLRISILVPNNIVIKNCWRKSNNLRAKSIEKPQTREKGKRELSILKRHCAQNGRGKTATTVLRRYSAINDIRQHDLFGIYLDIVHLLRPAYRIGSFWLLVRAHSCGHLIYDPFDLLPRLAPRHNEDRRCGAFPQWRFIIVGVVNDGWKVVRTGGRDRCDAK